MEQLFVALDKSDNVTVHQATEDEFYDWDSYLNNFCSDYKSLIKQNHIFSCDISDARKGNKFIANLCESDLDQHKAVPKNIFKVGFCGRNTYQKGGKGLEQAIDSHPMIIKNAKDLLLMRIQATGINACEQVEMLENYRDIVPPEHWGMFCTKSYQKKL